MEQRRRRCAGGVPRGRAVLYDIVGGQHEGWPAVRAFFARGLRTWPDVSLDPERFWTSDDGVALGWVMSATVTGASPPRFGAHAVGRRWRSEGMTWLVIDDGRVVREVDHHDSGAPARSLAVDAPADHGAVHGDRADGSPG